MRIEQRSGGDRADPPIQIGSRGGGGVATWGKWGAGGLGFRVVGVDKGAVVGWPVGPCQVRPAWWGGRLGRLGRGPVGEAGGSFPLLIFICYFCFLSVSFYFSFSKLPKWHLNRFNKFMPLPQ